MESNVKGGGFIAISHRFILRTRILRNTGIKFTFLPPSPLSLSLSKKVQVLKIRMTSMAQLVCATMERRTTMVSPRFRERFILSLAFVRVVVTDSAYLPCPRMHRATNQERNLHSTRPANSPLNVPPYLSS